jgi:hypothetical protein
LHQDGSLLSSIARRARGEIDSRRAKAKKKELPSVVLEEYGS